MPTGLYVGLGGVATITNRSHRPAGSTTLLVRSSTRVSVTAGAILHFGFITAMVATLATLEANTEATVFLSEPLAAGLPKGATAEVTSLHRVHGTSNSDFAGSTTFADSTPAIGSSVWKQQVPTQMSWTLDRAGNYHGDDPAFLLIRDAWRTATPVRVVRILPTPDGNPGQVTSGTALIGDFRDDAPAPGIVSASWVFQGSGEPAFSDDGEVPGIEPDVSGIMLDFADSDNAINFGFL